MSASFGGFAGALFSVVGTPRHQGQPSAKPLATSSSARRGWAADPLPLPCRMEPARGCGCSGRLEHQGEAASTLLLGVGEFAAHQFGEGPGERQSQAERGGQAGDCVGCLERFEDPLPVLLRHPVSVVQD